MYDNNINNSQANVTSKILPTNNIITALLILNVKMISIYTFYFCTFNSICSCPAGLYHSHHKCSHLHYKQAVTLTKQSVNMHAQVYKLYRK